MVASSHPAGDSSPRRTRLGLPGIGMLVLLGTIVAVTVTQVLTGSPSRDAPTDLHAASAQLTPLPRAATGAYGYNSAPFIQDNLWTDGETQYAVWVDPEGRPVVAHRALPSRQWETADLAMVPGNPLAAPTERNPHNVYVVATDRRGFVHVAGNMSNDPLRYARSAEPHDLGSWHAATMIGSDESAISYPAFVRDPDGDLLFFYREGLGTSDDVYINRWDEVTETWERLTHLIDGDASNENPYLNHIAVDEKTRTIHVMWVWRATTDPATTNDVSYARSRDGGRTWERSDGEQLSLPITHATAEVVVDTAPSGSGLVNNGGLEVDSEGRPHGVLRIDDEHSRRLVHVWHDGDGWVRRDVALGPSLRSRPAVVTSASGAVAAIVTQSESPSSAVLVLVDLLSEGDPPPVRRIATLSETGWEPSFDTQALYARDELHMLVTGDPARRSDHRGEVLSLSLEE